jgi:nucleoside 2-deoxyribosyltransferase
MQVSELARFRLVYLATPYSKYEGGLDRAHEDACMLGGALIGQGVKIFCPISHSHSLCTLGGVDPFSHNTWLEIDERLMEAADALLVAELDGWDESVGIGYEADVFAAAGKPVYYLDPVTMEIRR